jgi:sulfide:quinone oxidoreductase
MASTSSTPRPSHVVIVGGGVAALEAALAVRELVTDRLRITVVAPNREFVYRPMTVREPFAYGSAERYDVGELTSEIGAELVVDSLSWVDAEARVLHTESDGQIVYDELVLALGARPRPCFEHALTLDDRHLDEILHGVIQDVEGGYVQRLAFVVPARMAWPLPIYELALMTSRRAFDQNVKLAVTIVTPEKAPLAIFGDGASAAVGELLEKSGITVLTSATCAVPDGRHVLVEPGNRRLAVDRVIALPELDGPSVRGLPAGDHGFIPIDPHCRVRGVDHVYAAGDATDFPVKYGGIAAQQADTAIQMIAAAAGLAVEPEPLHPVIHGILLTGAAPLCVNARIIGGHGFTVRAGDTPTDTPPAKLVARHLSPYLAERDRLARAGR